MRGVAAGAGEAEALLGLGDHVGQRRGIVALRISGECAQARLGIEDRPGDGGRVTAVDDHRGEAVVAQVLGQPGRTALLHDLGALLDAPTVEDHHRNGQAAVLGAPPARRPVGAALLLERAVAEEGHQALARQRRVHVLQPGEAEVAALGNRAGGVRPGVAAQRHGGQALAIDGVGVEIADQARQPRLAAVVAPALGRRQVTGQRIDRLDGRHAVALPHQPAPGGAAQGIGQQVADEGRHHVQRAAGVALRRRLEVLGGKVGAGKVDAPRIGHVRHHAQRHAGQPVRRREQRMGRPGIGDAALGHQARDLRLQALHGLLAMADRTEARLPPRECVQTITHARCLLSCAWRHSPARSRRRPCSMSMHRASAAALRGERSQTVADSGQV